MLLIGSYVGKGRIRVTRDCLQERLLTMLLLQNPRRQKPAKFLRDMVRAQAELCRLRAHFEELEELRMQEVALWAPYRHVVWHGMAIIKALSSLQNLLPAFPYESRELSGSHQAGSEQHER